MKKIQISVAVLVLIYILGMPAAFAQDYTEETIQKAGALLTDSYRYLTDSDIAVVSRQALQAMLMPEQADAAQSGLVCVKKLSGQDVFDLIGTNIERGRDDYPYFSGVSASVKTVFEDGGVRREALEALYIADTPINFEAKYTVALSGDFAAAYETHETIASYTPDGALLGGYITSFWQSDGQAQQSGAPAAEDNAPQTSQKDSVAILRNQTTILLVALSLLAIALVTYLVVWRRKKKEEQSNKSL